MNDGRHCDFQVGTRCRTGDLANGFGSAARDHFATLRAPFRT
jgi:hypothetical protein